MQSADICPHCGTPFPGGTWGGRCPRCLLGLGFAAPPDPPPAAERPAGSTPDAAGGPGLGGGLEASPPRRLGDYELLEEISRGGMGVVYRARQLSLQRVVAVKLLLVGRFASPESIHRFEREARAAARLHHPNIVAIHEYGLVEGQPYLSMDLVEGSHLGRLVRDQPLSPQDAARYVRDIARAVEYAHTQGILHRDLKPSNILIDAEDQPRLTDFGLAKVLGEGLDVTLTGQALGSPNYMAPEQAAGRHEIVGPAADLYSLGAILYHLLTGRPPFLAATLTGTLRQVLESEPVAPRQLNPHLPRDLETLCLKCLDKQPERRLATAGALAEELDRFLQGEPIRARPIGAAERSLRWCRRNPRLAGLGAALMLCVLTVVVLGGWARVQAVRARRAETLEREQRRTVEAQKEDLRQRLVRSCLEAGDRLAESGDTTGALAWYVEAFGLDAGHPEDEDAHRLRIASILQRCPTLERMMEYRHSIRVAALTRDGRRIFTHSGPSPKVGGRWASDEGVAALWDLATGQPMWPPLPHHCLGFGGGDRKPIGVRYRPLDASDRLCFTFTTTGEVASNAVSEVHIHQTADGARVGVPLVHPGFIAFAEFSPDGRWIAVGTTGEHPDGRFKGEAHVWEVATGDRVCPLLPHGGPVTATRFSPDGRRLLTASVDGTVHLWELPSGRERFPAVQTGNGIIHATFDHAGRRFATAGNAFDNNPVLVDLWDADTGGRLWAPDRPTPQKSAIYEVQFSEDDRWLLSNGFDSLVCLWEVATGRLAFPPIRHETFVTRATFTPDGEAFVTGSARGWVRFWRVADGSVADPHIFLNGYITDLRVTPDNNRLLTGSDNFVQVWRLAREGTQPMTLRHTSIVPFAGFSPDGASVLTASSDGTARLWDTVTGQPRTPAMKHDSGVSHAAFSPDGRLVATASFDGTARLWDAATGEPRSGSLRHQHGVWHVAFDATGRRLATASGAVPGADHVANSAYQLHWREPGFGWDRRHFAEARLWDVATGELLHALRHDGAVIQATFSPDGRTVLTAGVGGARLWDATTGDPLARLLQFDGIVGHARFSPDGTRILAGIRWNEKWEFATPLWDARTGVPATPPFPYQDRIEDARFSPDGARIVTVAWLNHVQLWDAQTTELAVPVLLHPTQIATVATFSPDGRWLATGDDTGAVRIWEARTGKSVVNFPNQTLPEDFAYQGNKSSYITCIDFSPDSQRLVAASYGGLARVWSLPSETRSLDQLQHLARRLSGRRVDAAFRLSLPKNSATIMERKQGDPPMAPTSSNRPPEVVER